MFKRSYNSRYRRYNIIYVPTIYIYIINNIVFSICLREYYCTICFLSRTQASKFSFNKTNLVLLLVSINIRVN